MPTGGPGRTIRPLSFNNISFIVKVISRDKLQFVYLNCCSCCDQTTPVCPASSILQAQDYDNLPTILNHNLYWVTWHWLETYDKMALNCTALISP